MLVLHGMIESDHWIISPLKVGMLWTFQKGDEMNPPTKSLQPIEKKLKSYEQKM